MEDVRVVLVKPGDVLLIGNIGDDAVPEEFEKLGEMFRSIGLRAALFADDIDIDALPAENLAKLISEGDS